MSTVLTFEPVIPALATSTLTGPNSRSASATASAQPASLVTSSRRKRAFAPSSAVSASPAAALTSVTNTLAPSATSLRACASPMPCAAPVTIAILPVSRPMVVSLPFSFSRIAPGRLPYRNEKGRQNNPPPPFTASSDASIPERERSAVSHRPAGHAPARITVIGWRGEVVLVENVLAVDGEFPLPVIAADAGAKVNRRV